MFTIIRLGKEGINFFKSLFFIEKCNQGAGIKNILHCASSSWKRLRWCASSRAMSSCFQRRNVSTVRVAPMLFLSRFYGSEYWTNLLGKGDKKQSSFRFYRLEFPWVYPKQAVCFLKCLPFSVLPSSWVIAYTTEAKDTMCRQKRRRVLTNPNPFLHG